MMKMKWGYRKKKLIWERKGRAKHCRAVDKV